MATGGDEKKDPPKTGWTLGEVARGALLSAIEVAPSPELLLETHTATRIEAPGTPERSIEVVYRYPKHHLEPGGPDLDEQLVDRVRAYAAESRAEATRRAYATSWRAFEEWCVGQGVAALPAAPTVVAAYLAAMADEGLSLSTIQRARAAIVVTHRLAGHDWPPYDPATAAVLSGIRRKLGVAPRKKAPIVVADLAKLVAAADPNLRGARDRAMMLVGWAGALRRSELVALDVADLTFVPDGVVVVVRFSKTDQEGEGLSKGIPYAEDASLCPVRALETWLREASLTHGAVFRPVEKDGSVSVERLSDRAVARIVQKLAALAGLDARRVAGHSLRAGFITSAAANGRDLDAIMSQTGHTSERVVRGYIRHATVFTRNAVKGLL